MEKKKIVILGGGYAGVHAAKKLAKELKKFKDRVEITLIDRNKHHILMTELHEIAGNRVDEASVKISFDRIFAGKRVNVIRDEIKTIDFKEQVLYGARASYPYDQIIIASGAESTDFNVPGVKDHAFFAWGLQDVLQIKRHIMDSVRIASYMSDPVERKEKLTFVVAGGGFTGVEITGELIEWLPILCEEYGVDHEEVTLMNIEALGSILNMLPEKPKNKAIAYMEKHGVTVRTNSLIVNADAESITLKDGTIIRTRTLIWTCGIRGTTFCHELNLTKGRVQRMQVDQFMKSPDYDNVFLAGDGAWFLENDRPIPQIVEAAEQTAATASDGIIFNIKKEFGVEAKPVQPYKSNFHGYMVSIGGRYAVSYTGGMALSGFPAMAIKHLVNMYYQAGICGINGAWGYVKHEILNIKNKRSLIGGFASYKVQGYWLAFLRIYLGVMWLIEGIGKINEGWLSDVTGSKVYWGAPTGNEGDAVSAASAVVAGGAETVANTVTQAVTAVGDTVQQFAPPLLSHPLALFTWMNNNLVALAPYFFQVMITFSEVGIGLALIAGLLTGPAAVVSLGLSTMFLIGALAGKEIIWYMAVSIVMIGGAGRAFGLDYWVMPWIKKTWNKIPFAKRLYIFMDEPVYTKKQMKRKLAKNKDITI
ncbi:MAG: FAD-dependent oxidoreductase [Spirochaetaceae bacterium]|nr:FAD-dependent oxidoreductase [Spirochaetaceae bacterium]